MNQRELIKMFAEKADIPTSKAKAIFMDILPSIIFSELKKNGSFKMANLGKLKLVKTKARTGISPATKKPITIPAKTKIRFLSSKDTKAKIQKL